MNITDQLAQALPSCLVCGHARPFHVWWADVPAAGVCVECCNIVRAYRASKEGEKVEYRDLLPDEDRFEEGDQFQTPDGTWWQIPASNIGKVYFRRAYLPHRRPIRAT